MIINDMCMPSVAQEQHRKVLHYTQINMEIHYTHLYSIKQYTSSNCDIIPTNNVVLVLPESNNVRNSNVLVLIHMQKGPG